MHTNRLSAEEYCEHRRVNGSVFYLQEMPALQFDSGSGTLFVTQFNIRNPLRDFYPLRYKPLSSGEENFGGEADLITNLRVGEPLRLVAECFEPSSAHWSAEPSETAPVVTV